MQIKVEKLAALVYAGDWHDPPLKWAVIGPGEERQLFSLKRHALLYARLRRKAPDARAAENQFVKEA